MKQFIRQTGLAAASLILTLASAAAPLEKMPHDPNDLRVLFDGSNMRGSVVKPMKQARKSPRRAAENESTYFAALQSFHEGYTFNYTGGDVFTYEVGVSIDGNTAVISNLFNLDAEGHEGYNLVGTYDASASTITIATPTDFNEGTIVGMQWGSYPLLLLAGDVNRAGGFKPVESLVFNLSDNNQTITTSSSIALMAYSAEGQIYGAHKVYKSALLHVPGDDPWLVSFPEVIDFGKVSVFDEVSAKATLVNMSNADCEFVVDLSGEGTSVTPDAGMIPALGTQDLDVSLSFNEVGDGEALIEVVNDGESLYLQVAAEVVKNPNLKAIGITGDMTLITSANYPFELNMRLEDFPVAKSSNMRDGNTDSYLIARVEVPEGQIGRFSWNGKANSKVYYCGQPRVLVDGQEWGWQEEGMPFYFDGFMPFLQGENIDISGEVLLPAGRHDVTFNYYVYSENYGADNDYMYVWNLGMELVEAEDYKAELKDQEANAGYFILKDANVEADARVRITNLGSKPLSITGSTDSAHFFVQPTKAEAAILEDLNVTVTFKADAVGEYDETVTVTTTAGTFEIPCKAVVREMDDFSKIVTEGEFTFDTSAEFPFILVDGKAQNSTAKILDTKETTSWLVAEFTVPEGKLGTVTWKGAVDCSEYFTSSGAMTDYGGWDFQGVTSLGSKWWSGKEDMSSDTFSVEGFNVVTPGTGFVQFFFKQYGDNYYEGEDRLQIWDLAITFEDLKEDYAEVSADNVSFPTVFQGKESSATITFTNKGANPLEILEIVRDDNFYADMPEIWTPLYYNKSVDMTIWFNPETSGKIEGKVIVRTSAGDFTINCSGESKSTDGYALVEDFENREIDWIFIDNDGDWYNWKEADMLFYGADMTEICHSGVNCIGSASYHPYGGALSPDNWALSPVFTVPDNAILSWWVAAQWEERLDDTYEVYISEVPRADLIYDEADYTSLFKETVKNTEWEERSVSLADYAGKTVHLAFRHHDCHDSYLIKFDDVFVTSSTGVGLNKADATVKEVIWHSLNGMRLDAPAKGIYLMETIYTDGSRKVEKKIVD